MTDVLSSISELVLDEALRARLAALSPAKRAFIEEQLRAARRAPAVEQGIPRRTTGDVAPLSFAQELLWWIEQTTPGTATYNVPRAMRIRGELDVARLQAALDAIVARHEILRTTFEERGDQPVQHIGKARPVLIERVDLSSDAGNEQAARLDAILRARAAMPFDLGADLLLRAVLVRLAADEHVLLLVSHHLASDGSSRDILFRELSELYAGGADAPAPLPVQYGDFAAWQRSHLSGATIDRLLGYWRGQLDGADGEIELPLDRPRTNLPSFEGARHVVTLPPALTSRVVAFASAAGATPFMVLLAAFQTLLHRYSGQDDLVVGSVLTGRGAPELDGLIGYFSNALPLRARFGGDPSFAALLAQVRVTCLGATEHSELPYEKLALELRGARAAQAPLFRVLFAMLDEGRAAPSLGGAVVEPVTITRDIAKFDLTFGAGLLDAGLRVVLEYRTDLFDAATTERMVGHFGTLLEGAIAAPDERVSALPILTSAEREQLLDAWNATDVPYATGATLVSLFEKQACRTPEATAVASGATTMSYAALDAASERFERALRAAGVRRGTLVGICMTRSERMVAALLGILRAGAAYVPLDPAYPAERLAFILEDTGAPLVVTERQVIDALPWLRGASADVGDRALVIADEVLSTAPSEAAGAEDRRPEQAAPEPGDAAYIIYTSGSTGRPKGVVIEHRSAVALVSWARSVFSRDELAGVLAATSICFDLSVFELFVTLSSGGTVVVASDALALPDAVLTSPVPITLVNTVPSAIAELLRGDAIPASVRTVNLAGELLPQRTVDALYGRQHIARVYDLYGPSEDTTYSTFVLRERAGRPTIGRPIANTRAYVLDAHRQPVPIGVPGELYLAGAGLARGYLNRPELTAERFITVTLPNGRTERVYRTGDRVRYLADGRLEYLGRFDHQVKLRGFRIELGEIEAAVAAVPGVTHTAVIVRNVAEGDSRLLCYFVADAAAPSHVDAGVLRDAVAGTLPAYMVPSAFIRLDALPLSANGKLDRAALPLPSDLDHGTGVAPAEFVEPAGGVEMTIAAIWRDVLGVDRVGARDDFFDLGGHSLLAMRVLGRIAAAYGVRVTLRSFVDAPTVAALATKVEGSAVVASSASVGVPKRSAPAAPLSAAQENLWLVQEAEPSLAAYNVRDARRIAGELDAAALERALSDLLARHEALRTVFRSEGDRVVQSPLDGARLVLERRDLRDGAWVDDVLREFGARPFDLRRDVLLRALLVRTGEAEHVLLLVSHHILCDGWSLGVIFRDLGALYARAIGMDVELAPAPIGFGDWTAWRAADHAANDDALAYWREALAGAPTALALPADRVRRAAPGHAGAHVVHVVSRKLLERVRAFARVHDTTVFVTLLAAFDALLARYSRQDDLVVGVPVAGRDHPATEDVVGYFANTIPVRVRLDGAPSFAALVARVRDAYVGAYDHATIPPQRLAADLFGGAGPLVQALFILQDGTARADSLGPLATEPVTFESGSAKLDITLSATERADGLRLSLEYRAELFEPATAEAMLRHFETLLASAVETPDAPLATLGMSPDDEVTETTTAREASVREYPRRATLGELVAAQAALTPDVIAVEDDATALTYGALLARADAFASRLRVLGAGPNTLVAICMDRSVEMIVALLGIVRAGAAYVPLDPAFPMARLALVLEDCRAPIVVTEPSLHGLVDDVVRAVHSQPLYAPAVTHVGGASEATAPAASATAESRAYVLYTSGSTGKPKGVGVPHGALVNFLWAITRRRDERVAAIGADPARPQLIGPEDTVLAVTTLAFDIAGLELWGPLVAGGRVVLAPRATVVDGAALAERLRTSEATVLQATPATWRLLQAAGWQPTPQLRMLVGGEALPPALALALLGGEHQSAQPTPDALELWNLYGPTETTIWSATARITRDVAERAVAGQGVIPLGHALANEQLVILEPSGAVAPLGVPGELVIAGDGVAEGYLNRPELTAERFITLPALPALGRAYRTGDLVRRRADGTLEFLGRLDTQVKLRGYRIELGEIERTLLTHPSVAEAVVTLTPPADGAGDARLVAYVVPAAGMALDVRAMSEHCRAQLPDYMVPSAWSILASLPLTPNGKIDRAALARMHADTEIVPAGRAPRTAVEALVAGIWGDVLGVDTVSTDGDFHSLGGHSLAAMRIVARLRELLGVDLTIGAFLRAATVENVARQITADLDPAGSGEIENEIARFLAEIAEPTLPESAAVASPTGAPS